MGLWNFVKSAGKKLGIGSAEAAPAPEELKSELKELGLPDDVEVSVEGDKVKLKGRVPSQEVKEKVILAVGNVEGVGEVEEEIESATDAAEPVFHTVQKGDARC